MLGIGQSGAYCPLALLQISKAPIPVTDEVVLLAIAVLAGIGPMEVGVVGVGNALRVAGVPLMVVRTGVIVLIPLGETRVTHGVIPAVILLEC